MGFRPMVEIIIITVECGLTVSDCPVLSTSGPVDVVPEPGLNNSAGTMLAPNSPNSPNSPNRSGQPQAA